MAVSIPGGATLAADGKTWQDAAGKPLTADQIDAIEAMHADRTASRDMAEAQRLTAEAKSNPIASALMAVLSGQRATQPSFAGTAMSGPQGAPVHSNTPPSPDDKGVQGGKGAPKP